MATIVEQVNSNPLYGGITDGYRRAQLGQPNGTVGQPPQFRGVANAPGQDVQAPKILSSAARNNRGTNITIPYPRIVPADELSDKGRLSPGDVAFVSRYQVGVGRVKERTDPYGRRVGQVQNAVTTSAMVPHATVSQLVGIDYINKRLGPDNYVENKTVLVDSKNPADDWRRLEVINQYPLDGIVMSADSPGYAISSSHAGARNDQIFNVVVQGLAQLNNGYQDDAGHGVAAHHDRAAQLAAGQMGLRLPPGMKRSEFTQGAASEQARIRALIGGPFYQQYPLQMFDRKVRPMSELYVGLVCRKIDTADELASVNSENDGRFAGAGHIHVFQYVCFSSRQVWQFAKKGGGRDLDIVDTNAFPGSAKSNKTMNLGTAEPASRRRGPLDPNADRSAVEYLPTKRQKVEHPSLNESFMGIREIEVKNMVGAWRIGRVLDVASQRKESSMGGPSDTACAVTLNVDVSFHDWRALRRSFSMTTFGEDLFPNGTWTFDSKMGKFTEDFGRVMQWPTMYHVYDTTPDTKDNDNIPINPNIRNPNVRGLPRPAEEVYITNETEQEQRRTYAEAVEYGNVFDPSTGYHIAQIEFMGSAPGASALPSESAAVPPAAAAPAAAPAAIDPVQESGVQESGSIAAEAAEPAPPPEARKKASRPVAALSGVIGDEVVASIFGGSGAAPAAAAPTAPRAASTSNPSAQPKSFPRRSR